MKRFDITKNLALSIYKYRMANSIKGNDKKDWELAERYWGSGANRMMHNPVYFETWVKNNMGGR